LEEEADVVLPEAVAEPKVISLPAAADAKELVAEL
jgi:hypothetical protein